MAVVGAGTLRRPEGLPAAAVWGLASLWSGLVALPIAAERRLPLLVAAAALLAVGAWASPWFGRPAVVAGRAVALGVVATGGDLAQVAVLALSAAYVLDPFRPAVLTAHPATAWWWPDLGFYAAAAAIAAGVGSQLRRAVLAPLATVPAVAALLLGLRVAYAALPLDPLRWLPLLAVVGAAVAIGALTIRMRGLGPGREDPFAARFGNQVAAVGAVLGALSLVAMLPLTATYVLVVYDALAMAGAGLLLVPPFLRSFDPDGFGWALVYGGEALALVFVGLALRRRTPVAAGAVGITVVTLRQTLDAVNALPTWAILGVVGLGLLAIGTLSLAAHDALLAWLARGWARWSRLR